MKTVRWLVEGRVQGVGFRAFTRREARALGVRGTVKNLADGRVEIYAAADAETLRQFRDRISSGPSFGRVDDLDEQPAPDFDLPEGFDVVY